MALRIYAGCALRYRYRYLEHLSWSPLSAATPEGRKAMERGDAFHLMARRYYSGVDPGLVADPVEQRDLDSWLQKLQGFMPLTFDRTFYPELELRLNVPGLNMLAKFDLLMAEPDGRAIIFDWKTEQRLPRRALLAQNPQTLVYRYMLVAAGSAYSPLGGFRPEQVSMIYWNPLHPGKWEAFPYSESEYRAGEARLQTIAREIRETAPAEFRPTNDSSVCVTCEFRMLCHRRRPQDAGEAEAEGEGAADRTEWDLPLDPI